MKSRWHRALVLLLSASYLAAVTFGHCFHNHGAGLQSACGRSVGHGECGGHNSGADASEHCSGHHADDHHAGWAADDAGRAPASPGTCVADHGCPVCSFLSNHCVPIVATDVLTAGRVADRVAGASSFIVAGAQAGPQQPRAPPQAA